MGSWEKIMPIRTYEEYLTTQYPNEDGPNAAIMYLSDPAAVTALDARIKRFNEEELPRIIANQDLSAVNHFCTEITEMLKQTK